MFLLQRESIFSKGIESIVIIIIVGYSHTAWISPRIIVLCTRNSRIIIEVLYMLIRWLTIEIPCIICIDYQAFDRSNFHSTGHPQIILLVLCITTLFHNGYRIGVAALSGVMSIRMFYWHQRAQVTLHHTRIRRQPWISGRVHSCSTTGRVQLIGVSMSNLCRYIQPFSDIGWDIYISIIFIVLIVSCFQNTTLIVHTYRCVVSSTVITTADVGCIDLRERSFI